MNTTENGRPFELLKFPTPQPKPRPVGVSPLLERCMLGLAVLEQFNRQSVEVLDSHVNDYLLRKYTGLTLDQWLAREKR